MKPPTIKLNEYYSVKYIQVPYDNRYYVIMRGNVECCRVKNCETEFLYYFVNGIRSKMDPIEMFNLTKRWEKFEARVKKKDQYLDK